MPDGAGTVQCPRCGKDVAPPAGGDWISSIDMGDLSLEEEQEQEPSGPQIPTPTAPAQQPARAAEAPGGPSMPAARQPSRAARAPGARAIIPTESAVEGPPTPESLLQLYRIISERPSDGAPLFEEGIKHKSFVTQTVVTLLILSLVTAVANTYFMFPGQFAVGRMAVNWAGLIVELAVGCAIVSMLAYAFKREARPLGICQGQAVVRVGALIFAAVIGIILAVVAFVIVQRAGGGVPAGLQRARNYVWLPYLLLVFCGQTLIVMAVLRLGCLFALILGGMFTYAGYVMAQNVLGAF